MRGLQGKCAIVTGARRGTKLLDTDSLRWQLFRGPWQHIHRPRPYINRVRNFLKKHAFSR